MFTSFFCSCYLSEENRVAISTVPEHQCIVSKDRILCTTYTELVIEDKQCCGAISVIAAESLPLLNVEECNVKESISGAVIYESKSVGTRKDDQAILWDTGDRIGIFIDLRPHRESVYFYKNEELIFMDALTARAPLVIVIDMDGGKVTAVQPKELPEQVKLLLSSGSTTNKQENILPS